MNLSVRQFALVVLGIACAVVIFQWNNAGGEAGHLGGMLAGFILTLLILLKEKLSSPRPVSYSRRPAPWSSRSAEREPYPTEAEVNEVMDKISRSGLSSLTEREREILKRASQR